MSDKDSLTVDELRERYPEAVAEIEQAVQSNLETQHKADIASACDAATKDERDRCAALVKNFGEHKDFLAKQIADGHDVPGAKAAAYDAGLGAKPAANGADPLNLATDTDGAQDEAGDDAKLIEKAKAFKSTYARNAYCKSVGIDPYDARLRD